MLDDGREVVLTYTHTSPNATLTTAYWLGLECALQRAPVAFCCDSSNEEPEPFL